MLSHIGSNLKINYNINGNIYLGSNISSIESDNTYIGKAWTATNRLLTKWNSCLSDKTKQIFFQAVPVSVLLYSCTIWILTKCLEKLGGNYMKMLQGYWKQHSRKH